jgi:hypothetical protein
MASLLPISTLRIRGGTAVYQNLSRYGTLWYQA